MTPSDIMDRMTLKNTKNMMLMPLHPEKKFTQGMRLMKEGMKMMEYSITELSRQSSRTIQNQKSNSLW